MGLANEVLSDPVIVSFKLAVDGVIYGRGIDRLYCSDIVHDHMEAISKIV